MMSEIITRPHENGWVRACIIVDLSHPFFRATQDPTIQTRDPPTQACLVKASPPHAERSQPTRLNKLGTARSASPEPLQKDRFISRSQVTYFFEISRGMNRGVIPSFSNGI